MKEVQVEKTNKDGKKIKKIVPENIASTYIKIGWRLVKEEVVTPKPIEK